ncbi:hypothetical protein TrRE_jg10420 [Triparma retinervis]|uniref:Uncharacterized protein n=1 Tax=Triparma retinervis TaxID=2557542 RepID=A0A9W7E610_9STRA|nr:hypothetical protein TrRE_jg10420 [Triparma retinervis]
MVTIFKWWGDQDALSSVEEALAMLPKFDSPPPSQSPKISKRLDSRRYSKYSKVEPIGKEDEYGNNRP